ncbi:MAG: PQQ-dependent dehydrogenase, methanol/ethanol family [Gemmatimonadetes bacterium]|nr:PQQ-dependent dehydrogenase, methanol/ethanol family [Gemmatimonadota bacterium]
MSRGHPVVAFAAILSLAALGTAALASTAAAQAGSASSTVVGAAEVVSDAEWRSHGRDLAERRYSPLDQITRDNVGSLTVAWTYDIPRRGARLEATPLVADGVMYATGPMSTVFALDARTGEELWYWDPGIPDEEQGGPSACCGDVNRGLAMHDDRLFVGLLDGRLVALDKASGHVEWAVQTTPAGQDYSITGAPRVFGDKVVIGNAGAEYGVRGYVTAFAVDDGEQLWRTYTVPGNPADGFESEAMRAAADTWTGEWWKIGAGGTVWDAMAYDAELDLLYIGTGNGSPWSRDHRSPGGGDNLYLSSILALDGETGEYQWHYQTTPGDDWDYTATQPLMLLDLEIGGQERKVIVQAPKNGFFYVIDRVTGEFISGQAFADDVSWATHVDESGRPVETPQARYGVSGTDTGAYLSPGPTGAHNWPPMSWNPETGFVYLPAKNNNFFYAMTETLEYQQGQWNTGTIFRGGERPERPEVQGPTTMLVAWDPVERREVWRMPTQGENGGTLSTAGALVFFGTGDRLVAFDAWTGVELWAATVGRGTASPISYAIDGVQYVTILGGRAVSGDRPEVDAPTVWTFVLGGGR